MSIPSHSGVFKVKHLTVVSSTSSTSRMVWGGRSMLSPGTVPRLKPPFMFQPFTWDLWGNMEQWTAEWWWKSREEVCVTGVDLGGTPLAIFSLPLEEIYQDHTSMPVLYMHLSFLSQVYMSWLVCHILYGFLYTYVGYVLKLYLYCLRTHIYCILYIHNYACLCIVFPFT